MSKEFLLASAMSTHAKDGFNKTVDKLQYREMGDKIADAKAGLTSSLQLTGEKFGGSQHVGTGPQSPLEKPVQRT